MDVDHPSAFPLGPEPLLSVRIVDFRPETGIADGYLDRIGGRHAAASASCPGRVEWLVPEHGARECVRARGHGGDHRDAVGYRWNDDRWSD